MIQIKLMADYQCYPLWGASPDAPTNIDPKTLNLSEGLQNELQKWAALFESATNQGLTGFESTKDKMAFAQQGEQLKQALQKELGACYNVDLQL